MTSNFKPNSDFLGEDHLVFQWNKQLYHEYDQICYTYKLNLAKPFISIQPLGNRWGEWRRELKTIIISRDLIAQHRWSAVISVLKHEIAHQIVDELFRITEPTHGLWFKKACGMLGIDTWASISDFDLKSQSISWQEQKLSEEDERLLRRVEKLLALATSANQNEAFAAMAKVQELYHLYNIGRLQQPRQSDNVTLIIHTDKKRLPNYYSALSSLLIRYFSVEIVFSKEFNQKHLTNFQIILVLGARHNVVIAEYVYHFLTSRIKLEWIAHKREKTATRSSESAFNFGVIKGFESKLEMQQSDLWRAKKDIKDLESYAPPLSNQALMQLQKNEVQDYLHFKFPRLSTRSSSRISWDQGAYEAGLTKGRSLNLQRPLSSSNQGVTQLLKS